VADFTVRYADWKGGDYGNKDPGKADSDQFSGINVYPYESGLLGPRAGVKLVPVTGIPNHTIVPGPLAFWAKDTKLVIVIGSTPYEVAISGGISSSWAAYPSTPLKPIKFVRGGGIPYSLSNNVLYKHASSASTVAVSTPAPLSYIIRWGYYFVGIDANVPWRIWFSTVDSAGAHFDTWGANDYLDIGDTEGITAMVPIFNTLYVGKASGWNAVSGVLGTLASVRGVITGNGPVDPRLTSLTTDNRIVYWPLGRSPAFFNGERVQIESEIELDLVRQTAPADSVIVTPTARRLILAASDTTQTRIFSYYASAWSRHTFPAPLGGFAPGDVRDGNQLPEDVVFAVLGPRTVGDPVQIVSYNHNLNRPGHNDDVWSSPFDVGGGGKFVSGNVSFPTYWEPIGRQVRVRSVIVQFRKWASGVVNSANTIRCQIDSIGTYQSGDRAGSVHDWIEPCERSSSSGTDDSWRANLGDQGYGNGFRVSFPRLVGVALREVVVLCDVRTDRT
jgi:hypothetical protein